MLKLVPTLTFGRSFRVPLALVVPMAMGNVSTASLWPYEPGVAYKYNYQFMILLNEDSNISSQSAAIGRSVGYKVSADVILTNIWQNTGDLREKLLKLELLRTKLHVPSTHSPVEETIKHSSKLDNLSYSPMYIHWKDGVIEKVYLSPDTRTMSNIKKGVASLFQLQHKGGAKKELDVSGLCDVFYKVDSKTVKKNKQLCRSPTKNIQTCQPSQLQSPEVTIASQLVYNLLPDANVVQTVTGREEIRMKVNIWKQAAVFVKSKFKLDLEEQLAEQNVIDVDSLKSAIEYLSRAQGFKLSEDTLEAIQEQGECGGNCKSLTSLVNEYKVHLMPENLSRIKSAAGFIKLIDGFRRASRKELFVLLKNADKKILPQLLDVLAAAQTKDALDAAFEIIDFDNDGTGIAERFLLCLSTSLCPTKTVIAETMKFAGRKFQNEKIRATTLITLSSLIKTYCANHPGSYNSPVVEDVRNFLQQGLLSCTEAQCMMIHLQALKNAALPGTIPVLVKYIKSGGKNGIVALEALKSIGEDHFTLEVIEVLHNVYNQFWPHQDSTARALAAELLVKSKPTAETVGGLICSLGERQQAELNSLVLAKIRDIQATNITVRSCIEKGMRNVSVGNYDNLAQNGTSTVYTKLLQATNDANVTFGINMEMRPSGMLKRTNFDLKLGNEKEDLLLMSLGLFVEGFGLSEEEQKEKEKPEEHSAGMELSVLGVHLRPYTFFTGTAELMGLVWSSAGSEPTPALQANLLWMDAVTSIPLQSGLFIDLVAKGAISADISGTIEVSMWNKNSHAVVKNRAALLVNGFARMGTSFAESQVDFAMGGTAQLDLIVDLDYSVKPMRICLQVEQPGFSFGHNVRKSENIPGSKHLIRTLKRRNIHFPGRSFALHQKNYNNCRQLLLKTQQSFW